MRGALHHGRPTARHRRRRSPRRRRAAPPGRARRRRRVPGRRLARARSSPRRRWPPTIRHRRRGSFEAISSQNRPSSAGLESRQASLRPVWATVPAISPFALARELDALARTRAPPPGASEAHRRTSPGHPRDRRRRTAACSATMQPTEWPIRIARSTSRRSSIRSRSSHPELDRIGAVRLRASPGAALVVGDRPMAPGFAGCELRPPRVRRASEAVDEDNRGPTLRARVALLVDERDVVELDRVRHVSSLFGTPRR